MPVHPKEESGKAAKWVLREVAKQPGLKMGWVKAQAVKRFGVSLSTISRAIQREAQ